MDSSSPQPSSPPPLPPPPPPPTTTELNNNMTTEATEILNRLIKITPEREIDTSQLYYAKKTCTPNRQQKLITSSSMPTKSMQQHLIQLYFKHCYSTCPIIPKRLFFKQFESSSSKTTKSLTIPILLLMMFAHGAQYQQKTFNDADTYFKQAKSLLDNELTHPTLSTIITLVLMALYDSIENKYATMYSAMAFQLCFDLDLMRNYSGDYLFNKPTVSEDLELKKRICWSCYYLDKLIHIQQGQPWIMKRQDIELDLPLLQPGDDVIEHEILEGFCSMIKLLQIAERVLQPSSSANNSSNQPMIRSHSSANNNEQIVSLNNDNKLLHWLRSLPCHLQWTPLISNTTTTIPTMPDPPSNSMLCQLHLMYNLIELYVLKPFSTLNAKSIHQRSITIATNITRLVTTLSDNTSWIFNYPFMIHALTEATKVHLGDCSFTDNPTIARHSQTMFQQAIQTLKSFITTENKKSSFISCLVAPFLIALDQVLTDATLVTTIEEEEMMTPFVLSNSLNRQQEEQQQPWSKLEYFAANGQLVTPPTVKSKATNHVQYYHPPVMTTQNPFYNTQHSAITDNHLFHLSTSSWRPHSGMTPDRIQYHTFYNSNDSWQQSINRKSQQLQESSSNSSNDIAAIVAQIQEQQNNKSSTSNTTASDSNTVVDNSNDWNNSNNNNNNTTTNNNNSNQSTPSQHEDLLYSLLQEEVSRPVIEQQPRYPAQYMNVGLGIYASAHQHHNDVIRQHLPVSGNSTMRPAAILTHQGQVIVQNHNNHHLNQNNNQ